MRTRIVVPVLLLVAGVVHADEPWQAVTVRDGVTVERRPVAGSKTYETRAFYAAPVGPEQVFAVLWNRRAYKEFVPYIAHEDILAEGDHDVLVYDQVKVPLVSDRDYVVRVHTELDAATRVRHVEFHSDDAAGPPEAKHHIRVRNIRGGWELHPRADGGTDVTYWMHSEPGGSIPAWIVNLVQKKEVPKYVHLICDRAVKLAAP